MLNYNSVQCIGFSVDTSSHDKYKGFKNDQDDLNERVKTIYEAIEKAHESKKICSGENCLKIFMAPEFYFRGERGAYSIEDSVKISETLRQMVNKPEYKDWLFVFGTTVAYSEGEKIFHKQFCGYNFSFIQKGNMDEKGSYVVQKKIRSDIDFISNSDIPESFTMQNIDYDRNFASDTVKKNYSGGSIIDVNGLRIGVDICADNKINRVNKELKDEKIMRIDLHLVTSCGLAHLKPSKYLSNMGVLFAVDGIYGCQVQIQRSFLGLNARMKRVYSVTSEIFQSNLNIRISKPIRIGDKTKNIDVVKMKACDSDIAKIKSSEDKNDLMF
jgi:hypothetical protein